MATRKWDLLTAQSGLTGSFPRAKIGHAFKALRGDLYLHGGLVIGILDKTKWKTWKHPQKGQLSCSVCALVLIKSLSTLRPVNCALTLIFWHRKRLVPELQTLQSP